MVHNLFSENGTESKIDGHHPPHTAVSPTAPRSGSRSKPGNTAQNPQPDAMADFCRNC